MGGVSIQSKNIVFIYAIDREHMQNEDVQAYFACADKFKTDVNVKMMPLAYRALPKFEKDFVETIEDTKRSDMLAVFFDMTPYEDTLKNRQACCELLKQAEQQDNILSIDALYSAQGITQLLKKTHKTTLHRIAVAGSKLCPD